MFYFEQFMRPLPPGSRPVGHYSQPPPSWHSKSVSNSKCDYFARDEVPQYNHLQKRSKTGSFDNDQGIQQYSLEDYRKQAHEIEWDPNVLKYPEAAETGEPCIDTKDSIDQVKFESFADNASFPHSPSYDSKPGVSQWHPGPASPYMHESAQNSASQSPEIALDSKLQKSLEQHPPTSLHVIAPDSFDMGLSTAESETPIEDFLELSLPLDYGEDYSLTRLNRNYQSTPNMKFEDKVSNDATYDFRYQQSTENDQILPMIGEVDNKFRLRATSFSHQPNSRSFRLDNRMNDAYFGVPTAASFGSGSPSPISFCDNDMAETNSTGAESLWPSSVAHNEIKPSIKKRPKVGRSRSAMTLPTFKSSASVSVHPLKSSSQSDRNLGDQMNPQAAVPKNNRRQFTIRRKRSTCHYCMEIGQNCGIVAGKCPNRPCDKCNSRHRHGRCRVKPNTSNNINPKGA